MEARSTPASRVLLAGLDGLDGLAYGAVAISPLWLHDWKSKAQASKAPQVVRLAGEPFRVLSKGWPGFPHVFEHDRGLIGINPDTGRSRRAQVKVSMRAEALHSPDGPTGEVAFWEGVVLPEVLGSDAFDRSLQVSRVDIHADAAGVEFDPHEVIRGVVSRSDRIVPIIEGGLLCGVAIGARGGSVYIRLYDKLRHIEHTGESAYLLDTYGSAGLRAGETVWRLEVELRRELFSTMRPRIRTASDAIASQASLWQYGVAEWARLATPDTATRKERWTTDSRWRLYQDAAFPAGPAVERVGRHRHTPRLRTLLPVLRGCAVKAGGLLGAEDWHTAWHRVGLLLWHDAADRGIDLDVEVTMARINTGEPLSSVLHDLARLFPIPGFEGGSS